MGKYIIIGIIFITTMPLWALGRHWLNKMTMKNHAVIKEPNFIKQPKGYLYIGIIFSLLNFGIALFALFMPKSMLSDPNDDSSRLMGAVFFEILSILSFFIALIQINWKIEIRKDEFIFTNIFRKKRTYKYSEVEVIVQSRSTHFYYKGKKILAISYMLENWYALEKAIITYQKRNKK